ncbi:MAG: glycosyltransferase [Bacteroidia bacterium]|nr:glycosyltransferase [Bacteroidia bacterium]MDW8088887.1 glycosyltransferase [Bacteroidia bacterium]
MTKIRVLRLVTRLNVGGPAHQVLLLTRDLAEWGPYETRLIAGQEPLGESRATPWIAAYGVAVEFLPSLQRKPSWLKDVSAFLWLWRTMRRWRPHILHTHTAKAGALGRLAAWLVGVPVRIHTYHGHSFEGYFSPGWSWVYRLVERFLASLTHRIIVISERQRRDIVERFQIAPPEKVVVIPLGFELERLDNYDAARVARLRRLWQRTENEILLGWIGRLVPIKRLDRLFEALRAIRAQAPPFRLVLVGEGPQRAAWEALGDSLGLRDLLVWVGLRWDIPEVLRALDAVVLTSDNEGTPVSLIEALACGTPVAATPVGGIPDLLEEGKWGWLLTEPLAESLLAFLQHLPQARQQAQASQAYIRQRYSHLRLLADIHTLYQSFAPNFAA